MKRARGNLGEGVKVSMESDGGLSVYLDQGPKPGPVDWHLVIAMPPKATEKLGRFLSTQEGMRRAAFRLGADKEGCVFGGCHELPEADKETDR